MPVDPDPPTPPTPPTGGGNSKKVNVKLRKSENKI